MIQKIRDSALVKVVWGLMVFYLINISADARDPNPQCFPENLQFNDQESLIEILIEKILGFEDAIKEYDDHDSEDHNKKSKVHFDFMIITLSLLLEKGGFAQCKKKKIHRSTLVVRSGAHID